MKNSILRINSLSKKFPGVMAVDSVSLEITRGETHALIGENGAGKSTLIKLLTGVYHPTNGTIEVDGKKCVFQTPIDAFNMGISVMHQETSLVPQLSVVNNVFLGQEYFKMGCFKLFDETTMQKHFRYISKKVGIELDPYAQVKELSVAQQKMVEIMKALVHDASIIVMDEPTDSLSQEEIKKLFSIIEDLKKNNVTIIYITHYLDEIFKIADTATVLRDGKRIITEKIKNLTQADVVTMMVGRKLERKNSPKRTYNKSEKTAIEIEKLYVKEKLYNINLSADYGEIIGITGVVGAGKTELARAIFGADKIQKGNILLDEKKTLCNSPARAVKVGIGMLPEDRKNHGLILKHETYKNMTLCNIKKICKNGVIKKKHEFRLCRKFKKELNIKIDDLYVQSASLSGGNQQKVVIAKWLMLNPDIIIMDEPTRGIDVGAKQEIYRIISNMAAKGKCVLFLTSEVDEVLQVAHRIVIMRKGKIVKEMNQDERDHKTIMHEMLQGGE